MTCLACKRSPQRYRPARLPGSHIFLMTCLACKRSPQRYRPARLPGSHIFRDIRRYPDAQCIPGLAIFRFDASLCFANIHIFLEALRLVMSDMERKCAAGLSCVVIEFGSINDVDASALRMLQDLHKELRERRVRLLFSSCKVSASDRLC